MDAQHSSEYGQSVPGRSGEDGTTSSPESERQRLNISVSLKKTAGKASGHLNPTPELMMFGGIKLGWIQGVLIPCLLNIWGVMLFLRISWIVAQAGIGLSVFIIFLSGVVCVITTLSLSAICTNGRLEGGGVYYLVSRSLGAELGASVGIIFAFANAVAASMNTIGFCDSLNELLQSNGLKILDNGTNDTRIIGAIALLIMCVICAIGMDWETKTQNFLITVIVLAIADYIIGASIGPTSKEQIAKGFVGINLQTAQENWNVNYRESEGMQYNFFSVFAMYFPAVTGVQAGANICGDLRNPATAIPKGTLLAVGISLTSYLTMAVLAGMGALRDASGDSSNLNHAVLASCKPNCEYGMHNNYQVMQLMSLWAPLIYAGCWAATLSTALTNLLSVPRLIQALGVDRIYPGLVYFAKGYGKHGEPYRGYVLTYFVSLGFVLIADLNTIAPLISNFYLASYALINFCTFHAGFINPISWRPSFRFHNKWLSLIGFLMCLGIMVVISWEMALATVFIFMTLYLLVIYTKPEANWGSSTDAQHYQDTVTTILQISRRAESIKSYVPQVLVLAGKPYSRPALLDLGNLLTKMGSFMIVADLEPVQLSWEKREGRIRLGEEWLQSRKDRAFFVLMDGIGVERGVRALTQATGLGRLTPNLVLIGYKTKWISVRHERIASYVQTLQYVFEERLAVAVLRAPSTARPPKSTQLTPPSPKMSRQSEITTRSQMTALMHSDSDITVDNEELVTTSTLLEPEEDEKYDSDKEMNRPSAIRHTMLNAYEPLSFNPNKPLDTWWLYDDGGINILLPYIIARRGFKEKRDFRIFALARSVLDKHEAHSYMEQLLARFRIEYNLLTIVQDLTSRHAPSEESWLLFNRVADKFKTTELQSDVLITEAELKKHHDKTCRYLRLRELLMQHSIGASFVVISLPVPRKGQVSACLYMTWLEIISMNMPPVLFVRGNQTVLDTYA